MISTEFQGCCSLERLVPADLGETGLAGDEAAAGPGHRPEDVAGARAGGPRRHERTLIPTPLLNIIIIIIPVHYHHHHHNS